MTCSDFNFSTRLNTSTKQYESYCQADPKGKEITQGFFHATSTAFNGGWNLGPSSQGVGPNGRSLTVGDRLPRAPMTFLVLGRCDHPCTQRYTISDRETRVQSLMPISVSIRTGPFARFPSICPLYPRGIKSR